MVVWLNQGSQEYTLIFCTLNRKGACFIPKRVGCWTGGQKLSQSALCVLAPLFRYSSCRMSSNLLPSPRPPLELLCVGPAGLVPGAWDAGIRPDASSVQSGVWCSFKELLGSPDCPGHAVCCGLLGLTLSRRSSLQSHRLWICSPALGDRRRINSYGRSAKCHLR